MFDLGQMPNWSLSPIGSPTVHKVPRHFQVNASKYSRAEKRFLHIALWNSDSILCRSFPPIPAIRAYRPLDLFRGEIHGWTDIGFGQTQLQPLRKFRFNNHPRVRGRQNIFVGLVLRSSLKNTKANGTGLVLNTVYVRPSLAARKARGRSIVPSTVHLQRL